MTESGAAVVGVAGSFTNNSTYTASTGIHNFTGATKTMNGTVAIPTATFTNNYTNTGTLTSATALTVTGAAIRLTNNGTITATTALSGNGGVTQGATGVLNIGGTSGITTLDASTNAGNTVNYNGAAQTVKVVNYYHLTLSGSGAKTFTVTTVGGNLTTSGTATVTTGAALAVAGNFFVGDGTTFTSNATFALTVSGTTTVGGGTSGTLAISTAATNTQTFTGTLTINSGANYTEMVAATLSFGSDVIINSGGTMTKWGRGSWCCRKFYKQQYLYCEHGCSYILRCNKDHQRDGCNSNGNIYGCEQLHE